MTGDNADRAAPSVARIVGTAGRPSPSEDRAALVLVGHGSRDPRSATHLARLADRVRELRPDLDVRLCFLELSVPSFEQVLGQLDGDAVVLPLLLGRAFHARVDIPAQLAAARLANRKLRAVLAPALGPDDALDRAAADRAVGLADCDGFVLLGTGSSDSAANARVQRTAARVRELVGLPISTAFVTADPTIDTAVTVLRDAGAHWLGVLPWFLAPGLLLDRGLEQAARCGVRRTAETLSDHQLIADLAVLRYESAAASPQWFRAGEQAQVRATS